MAQLLVGGLVGAILGLVAAYADHHRPGGCKRPMWDCGFTYVLIGGGGVAGAVIGLMAPVVVTAFR